MANNLNINRLSVQKDFGPIKKYNTCINNVQYMCPGFAKMFSILLVWELTITWLQMLVSEGYVMLLCLMVGELVIKEVNFRRLLI